jgi:hypothetical protein
VGESGNFQHILGEHGKKRDTNFVEHWKTMWIHGPFFYWNYTPKVNSRKKHELSLLLLNFLVRN